MGQPMDDGLDDEPETEAKNQTPAEQLVDQDNVAGEEKKE